MFGCCRCPSPPPPSEVNAVYSMNLRGITWTTKPMPVDLNLPATRTAAYIAASAMNRYHAKKCTVSTRSPVAAQVWIWWDVSKPPADVVFMVTPASDLNEIFRAITDVCPAPPIAQVVKD